MKGKVKLREGIIYEAILSTYNPDNTPNSAPIGIKYVGEDRIQAKLYRGSNTLNNILSRRCAVANLTCDPILFYNTALKIGGYSHADYSKARHVDAPKMRMAEGYIELELVNSIRRVNSILLEFKIKAAKWRRTVPNLYCRAFNALVEATIHATRIKTLLTQNKRREAERLTRLVNHYKDVIERVSSRTEYAAAIKEIERRIGEWRRGQGLSQNPLKTTYMPHRHEWRLRQSRRKPRSSHR
ncbi:MAG: DUF447 domain-containing protein [Candidatus Bathyarchaeia archaeon]